MSDNTARSSWSIPGQQEAWGWDAGIQGFGAGCRQPSLISGTTNEAADGVTEVSWAGLGDRDSPSPQHSRRDA